MAADSAFTVKAGNQTFTLDRITLGDWRMFKTALGLDAGDVIMAVPDGKGGTVQAFNLYDPSVLIGLMVAALHHERPNAKVSDLVAEVEALDMKSIEFPKAEDEEADENPKADDASEVVAGPSKPSKSGKPRKAPGARS